MGAGTLVELIARGSQDTFLIGNPQFSYFKSVYRRHTNFAIEPIRQIFTESPDFGKRVTCIIDKKADLLGDIILEIELPGLNDYVSNTGNINTLSWTNGIGNFILDWVELQIGGEPIDRIPGNLLDAWMELTTELGIKNSFYTMVGKFPSFINSTQTGALKLLVPLPFWFCRSVDRALPLISMQYVEIKIVVQFKTFDKCWYKITSAVPTGTPKISKANIICNYIYLDVFERTKFAQTQSTEYLIEQFQENNAYQVSQNIINVSATLFFNHPVKELIWMYRSTIASSYNDYYNYANVINYNTSNEKRIEPFSTINLRFNGNDRFEFLPGTFFRLFQPYKHHSCGTNQYIYVYSFGIEPEKMQPSGTCNFSKLDNVTLNVECNPNIADGILYVYATNYNILRIQSGMAGLMFSS